jgi:hypothetical protein
VDRVGRDGACQQSWYDDGGRQAERDHAREQPGRHQGHVRGESRSDARHRDHQQVARRHHRR